MRELLKWIGELIVSWFTYKHRGHAQPDQPDDKNYPIITGMGDASAQRIIDEATRPANPKK